MLGYAGLFLTTLISIMSVKDPPQIRMSREDCTSDQSILLPNSYEGQRGRHRAGGRVSQRSSHASSSMVVKRAQVSGQKGDGETGISALHSADPF